MFSTHLLHITSEDKPVILFHASLNQMTKKVFLKAENQLIQSYENYPPLKQKISSI